jgi:hypothetical protein
MSRTFRVVLWLTFFGLSLQAESWDVLRGLGAGDKIKVVDANHQELKGAFTAFSDRGLSLETAKGVVEIERARVSRVQGRAGSRRVRNILIGAGIGLAVGIAVDQTVGTFFRNEQGNNGGARALTYIAPIALFGGIGATLSSYRTIYRAR